MMYLHVRTVAGSMSNIIIIEFDSVAPPCFHCPLIGRALPELAAAYVKDTTYSNNECA
jgi:hypothetical protein